MDLEFATKYFDQFINFEQKSPKKKELNLKNMEILCEYFDHPEREIPCIHVAGSKGKGSVVTMIGHLVQAAESVPVGLYRSPALEHFTDRISGVYEPFPAEVYQKAFETLKSGVDELMKENKIERPTWFELVTLYAFLVFKEAGCEFAVYEVGMGGRFDATNVIKPKVAVITDIELEHTEILGDTLEKIAFEKAGIIKPGIKEVIYATPHNKAVEKVILDHAKRAHVPARRGSGDLQNWYHLEDGRMQMFFPQLDINTEFLGDCQARNVSLALKAVRAAGIYLTKWYIRLALDGLYIPGRCEFIMPRSWEWDYQGISYIFLDGAHTRDSAKESAKVINMYRHLLVREYDQQTPYELINLGENPVLLFACAKDKNVEEIAETLKGQFSKVILTSPGDFKIPDLPRAEKAFLKAGFEPVVTLDYKKAISEAFKSADQDYNGLVVLGSFYLVAEVKKFIRAC